MEFLATIMGVLMSLGYYPQAYRIWKNKSGRDVSLFTFGVFGAGTAVWTVYGIYLHNLPIILSFVVGAAGSWLVFGLALWYRRHSGEY